MALQNLNILENPWECICKIEWLGLWLSKLGSASTPSGSLRCLGTPCKEKKEKEIPIIQTEEFENHSYLITIIASVLALVAFLFLIAASYAYMQANYPINPLTLRNISSDRVRLIPSHENLLSFPNPLVLGSTDVLIKSSENLTPIPAISINVKENTTNTDKNCNLDKKRVRFNGI